MSEARLVTTLDEALSIAPRSMDKDALATWAADQALSIPLHKSMRHSWARHIYCDAEGFFLDNDEVVCIIWAPAALLLPLTSYQVVLRAMLNAHGENYGPHTVGTQTMPTAVKHDPGQTDRPASARLHLASDHSSATKRQQEKLEDIYESLSGLAKSGHLLPSPALLSAIGDIAVQASAVSRGFEAALGTSNVSHSPQNAFLF